MGKNNEPVKHGPESCHEECVKRRLHIIYTRQTRERQIFMSELKEIRKERQKEIFRLVKESVGPKWYQALSVPQRMALDTLESSIYKDLLEGRPMRSANIMRQLGLYPRPYSVDLMNCVYMCHKDPKEMLAQLYLATYGYPIDLKRGSYCLNARLMLSAILYLGFEHLIKLLREQFHNPPVDEPPPKPKPKKKKKPPLKSPYLQKMVAYLYEKPIKKRSPPPPLPSLDDLNEPYEEEPVLLKMPPPPPPPPPPPKKKLPQSYCDKLAGVMKVEPYKPPSKPDLLVKPSRLTKRNLRGSSKMSLTDGKKSFGMGSSAKQKKVRLKKPAIPRLNVSNAQYTINGVYTVNGRAVYVLGNITVLPAEGDLIHGGFKYLNGEYINIHCGYREWSPPPLPGHCDCVKTWHEKVFHYIKSKKCYCGHYYDYGIEGTFLPEELPFFTKPTRNTPMQFHYETIFDLNPKRLHVQKEFKALWETDSVLHVDDGTPKDTKDKKKKTEKKKRDSTTCLGDNPQPEDYLKCAFRLMRKVNVAARLPDLHLVPEFKEWMRRRLNGPLTAAEKKNMLRQSNKYWQMFQMLASKGFGHVSAPQVPAFMGHSTWSEKQDLNDKFKHFSFKYKLEMFRSHAYINNLFWPSMCQAEQPDKKFREIYFSYLLGTVDDLQLMHPYSTGETMERTVKLASKRCVCIPDGIETET